MLDEELSWAIQNVEKWSRIRIWPEGEERKIKKLSHVKREDVIFCYKCGEYGYLGKGRTESTYRSKDRRSPPTSIYDTKKGTYREVYNYYPMPNTAYPTTFIKKGTNRVLYGYYKTRIIRHYSSQEYHETMKRYRSHEIKSRPNGQTRHYVEKHVKFRYSSFAKSMVAYCEPRTCCDSYPRCSHHIDRLEKLYRF
jgi:hypothetical protein